MIMIFIFILCFLKGFCVVFGFFLLNEDVNDKIPLSPDDNSRP